MRSLWLEERRLELRTLPRPVPAPGEALIRVSCAGICNTDLELLRGYYPFSGVPGHEFVGCVLEAPGHEAWIGRRVVGEINVSCGACATCAAGRRTHCERRNVFGIRGRDGAFAELATLPVANLHPIPADLDDETAVFAEPLAAALEILEQVAVAAGDTVVVVGDGKLGNLVAQTLALTGCTLSVVGRHRAKLDLLAARGIATHLDAEPRAATADLVVECTGSPAGFAAARRLVRPRGTLVLKSTYAGDVTLDLASVVVDEITLVGSRCGPFAKAVALLESRAVDVRALIAARYPLTGALAAFERAAAPGVLKVLLKPAEDTA